MHSWCFHGLNNFLFTLRFFFFFHLTCNYGSNENHISIFFNILWYLWAFYWQKYLILGLHTITKARNISIPCQSDEDCASPKCHCSGLNLCVCGGDSIGLFEQTISKHLEVQKKVPWMGKKVHAQWVNHAENKILITNSQPSLKIVLLDNNDSYPYILFYDIFLFWCQKLKHICIYIHKS